MSARALAALAAAAALSGCASAPIFEGGRAWTEGWREGTVEKVVKKIRREKAPINTYDSDYGEDIDLEKSDDDEDEEDEDEDEYDSDFVDEDIDGDDDEPVRHAPRGRGNKSHLVKEEDIDD